MKSQELLEIIGDTQDTYIMDAQACRKRPTPVWARWVAIAAGLCLILGLGWAFGDSGGFEPAGYPNACYSAYDIANLFPKTLNSVSTNAYEKIYVPDGSYLQLGPIPEAETLPIYRYDDSRAVPLSGKELQDFIAKKLSNYCAALGIPTPGYDFDSEDSYWRIVTPDEYYYFSVWSKQSWTSFDLSVTYQTEDPTIRLNGYAVQVDQRQTDQEILASLEGVKAQLFAICGVSFSDAKILRYYDGYGENGVDRLVIYYYDAAAHPLNATADRPVSDHIRIYFDNMMNFDGDFVSDSILSRAKIEYMDYTDPTKDCYPRIANANRISLAEAEKLLYNGYVFGGHTCPLCMAGQEQVSFRGYDYVGFEYVFGYTEERKRGDVVPFYTFFKAIGIGENGNTVYAKTYVPAIEVSDLAAYFRNQLQSHDAG